jgi:16S rRNA (guanine1516-N2)-methyltransferase
VVEINLSSAELEDLARLGFALEIENEEGESRLALRDLHDPKMQPLAVDFTSGTVIHRLKHGLSKNQPLSRALGSKGGDEELSVFDATAGLGVDAFFIAALGYRVRAIERSPVVHALLQDGFRRLVRLIEEENFEDEMFTEKAIIGLRIVRDYLSFERGDAAEILRGLSEDQRPDVVYLDPMYPDEGRSKSALPKKGMQIFHRLIGDDRDAVAVFDLALKRAKKRVVVKRPLYATPLRENPTHTFEGKTARYDMYLSPLNQS